jgi:LysR family transcriptional regulator, glycine cleavage system transcriptional activator
VRYWTPPPLSAVRAFEAAARLSSFTKAAQELSITQGAVSHGVRELELRFKVSLFVRTSRSLVLTEAGKLYLPFAAEALGRLRAGDRAIFDPTRKDRVVTVSVSPSFAAKWLVPRLGEFTAAHPELDLRISASPVHINFADGEIDLAVRHGDGDWPNLNCTRLCEETLFPVCSPLLRGKPPRSPGELARHVLIHHRSNDAWRDWLSTFDAERDVDVSPGPVLNEMSLVIDAAIAGQGIALARSALANRDIAEGRLVRPMPHETPAKFAYWIVYPKTSSARPSIVQFRDWLLRQAKSGPRARNDLSLGSEVEQ